MQDGMQLNPCPFSCSLVVKPKVANPPPPNVIEISDDTDDELEIEIEEESMQCYFEEAKSNLFSHC